MSISVPQSFDQYNPLYFFFFFNFIIKTHWHQEKEKLKKKKFITKKCYLFLIPKINMKYAQNM